MKSINQTQAKDWATLTTELKKYIYSKVNDWNATDDIAQETLLKAFSKLNTLRDETKLVSWIYAIVKNEISNYFKDRVKSIDNLKPEDEEEIAMNHQLKACIIPCINHLPEKYKQALLLVEIENMSQKELAEKLNISYSGAKTRVQRGREKLRELFDQCCIIEHDTYGNILSYQAKSMQNKSCP